MRSIDLAYIAGMMDGEGCMSLNTRRGTGYTRVVIEINQNKREVLDWIREVTGLGKVYAKKTPRGLTHTWTCFAIEGREFIPLILPYLIVKKEQALTLMSYFNAVDTMKMGSKERKKHIDDLILSFRTLNERRSTCGS